MNSAESGMSTRNMRRREPINERGDAGRLLCGCVEDAFAFVLLVLSETVFALDEDVPLPFKMLPLLRLEGDGALPFAAVAVVIFTVDKGGGVALRTGLLGHIKWIGSAWMDV